MKGMKKFFIISMLVIASMTAWAQQQFGSQQSAPKSFTPQEQELIDLSNQKWAWMSEKNADKLAELFLPESQFVHMGGSWGKQQEVDIIRGGMIWYKKADIHSQEVKFTDKNVATVYSNIHLTSEVGGHQVRFPFMVSEVYIRQQNKEWKLSSLIFTKLAEPDPRFAPAVTLNNGIQMPQFGLGTYAQPSNEVARESVLTALRMGYRHIDTAHAYNDEEGVGQGIKDSGIPREEIWLTCKLWINEYGEGKTAKAIDDMLKRLQVDYIDLLYVHQPVGDFIGAWRDMEKAVRDGKVRALGISNFEVNDSVFDLIMEKAEIKPQVLQMECHPYAQRIEARQKAARLGLQVECWFPLDGQMSQGDLLKDPVIVEIAQRLKKSPAQIILRWHLQEGFSVIPGSKNPQHIMENVQIFDFALSDSDMQAIRALNKEQRVFPYDFKMMQQMAGN